MIFQIKVNSIAIVRMKSMDGGPELTVNRGVSAAEGANMCSVEQVCLSKRLSLCDFFVRLVILLLKSALVAYVSLKLIEV